MSYTFEEDAYSKEYLKNRLVLNNPTVIYGEPIATVMKSLWAVMGKGGFDRKFGDGLNTLRYKLKGAEAESILAAVGSMELITKDNSHFGIKIADLTFQQVKQAAAVKMLRHLYMEHIQGGSEIWIATSPHSYKKHISQHLSSYGRAIYRQYEALADIKEHFNADQRRQIAESTNEARRQLGLTLVALSAGKGQPNSRIHRVVRRWFSGSNVKDDQVDRDITTLINKLVKVQNLINANKIIYTDMPHSRHTDGSDDRKKRNIIAFVYPNMAEKIPVIYIEAGFFNGAGILSEKQGWANTVIHEITHLILATVDHRYRFEGMSPDHFMFLSRDKALENADSFSIFCADASETLSQYQKLYFSYGRSCMAPQPPVPPPKIASIGVGSGA